MSEWLIAASVLDESPATYALIAPDGQLVGWFASLEAAQEHQRSLLEESLKHEGPLKSPREDDVA